MANDATPQPTSKVPSAKELIKQANDETLAEVEKAYEALPALVAALDPATGPESELHKTHVEATMAGHKLRKRMLRNQEMLCDISLNGKPKPRTWKIWGIELDTPQAVRVAALTFIVIIYLENHGVDVPALIAQIVAAMKGGA